MQTDSNGYYEWISGLPKWVAAVFASAVASLIVIYLVVTLLALTTLNKFMLGMWQMNLIYATFFTLVVALGLVVKKPWKFAIGLCGMLVLVNFLERFPGAPSTEYAIRAFFYNWITMSLCFVWPLGITYLAQKLYEPTQSPNQKG